MMTTSPLTLPLLEIVPPNTIKFPLSFASSSTVTLPPKTTRSPLNISLFSRVKLLPKMTRPPSVRVPCAYAGLVGITSKTTRTKKVKNLFIVFIYQTPRGTRTNRHIETVHKRLTPAKAESKTIQANGERKSGMIRTNTEPAWASASIVVMINTPHCTSAAIHVAGAERNVSKYGEASHISITKPPKVNSSVPQSLRLRSASFRSARRAWKRVVKPTCGEAFFTDFNAIPVSARAEQYGQVLMCISNSRFCSCEMDLSFNSQSSKGW